MPAVLFTALLTPLLPCPAATVVWSEPLPIMGPMDISSLWNYERAYAMGASNSVTINQVTFQPFRARYLREKPPFPNVVLHDEVAVAISADKEGVFAQQGCASDGPFLAADQLRTLLDSSISSEGGSAFAIILKGLSVGRTYLIQIWASDTRVCAASQRLASGSAVSSPMAINTTRNYGSAGNHIVGIFTADSDVQTIVLNPQEGPPRINAFQVRLAPEKVRTSFIQQPVSAARHAGQTAHLSAMAHGPKTLSYQWQRIVDGRPRNLSNNARFFGSDSNRLTIVALEPGDSGVYRLVARDDDETIQSESVSVEILPPPANELINVDVNNGSSGTFKGDGVVVGTSGLDYWNGVDGVTSFTEFPLLNSAGSRTPVTLTLSKSKPDGYTSPHPARNDLLADYSPAPVQTVTLKHLEPESYYNLVAYSMGEKANEAGFFSGALEGIVYGRPGSAGDDFWQKRFWRGTNFIQNPFARSDASGTLQFQIASLASVQSNGFFNGCLNGLQIQKVDSKLLAPVITTQPQSVSSYANQRIALRVEALGAPSSSLKYQWYRVTKAGRTPLSDSSDFQGVKSTTLVIPNLDGQTSGEYQAVVSGMPAPAISAVATATIRPSPRLINVDIKHAATPVFAGQGVLSDYSGNYWNGVEGRSSFENVALRDDHGTPTPVTISLLKKQLDSYVSNRTTNNMLKDYSVGNPQTVTLRNLEPNSRYKLVVYSFGFMQNEGGVFSGAVSGIVHGWSGAPGEAARRFIPGTNYIENASAITDAKGILEFSIQATSTVTTNGFWNSDFNGLQLMRMYD